MVDPDLRYDNLRIRLRQDVTPAALSGSERPASDEEVLPAVSDEAVAGLKFSDVLPLELARDTIALRLTDPSAARRVAAERRTWVGSGDQQ